jgi:ABC-type dipeptide/oligopeptide/nickel transport system permease subunit
VWNVSRVVPNLLNFLFYFEFTNLLNIMNKFYHFLLFLVQFSLFSAGIVTALGVPQFIEEGDIQAVLICIVLSCISWFGFAKLIKV